MEFVRDDKKCHMKFLDADVKRPMASVSAIVDEGKIVVFGQHSYIETNAGRWIPSRRKGSFVVQDAQAARMTKVKFDEPNTNSFFSRPV